MVLERSIENYLIVRVRALGGFTLKLNPQGARGVPDRLVVLPGAVLFIELKRPKGGVLAKLQNVWRDRLTALGHGAHTANTKDMIDELLDRTLAEADPQIRDNEE